jgi:N-methylhydantoinase A
LVTPAQTISGPAIIEESESTVVVGPGGSATADDAGNLVVEVMIPEPSHGSHDGGDR